MTMKWYDPEAKLRAAVNAGLVAAGLQVTYYAKERVNKDTRNLMRSINWKVNGTSVTIGTPVEYGIYQEYGTGLFAEGGKGRKTGWAYKDEQTGKTVFTRGNRPRPFLRWALDKIKPDLDNIFFKEFKRILR